MKTTHQCKFSVYSPDIKVYKNIFTKPKFRSLQCEHVTLHYSKNHKSCTQPKNKNKKTHLCILAHLKSFLTSVSSSSITFGYHFIQIDFCVHLLLNTNDYESSHFNNW